MDVLCSDNVTRTVDDKAVTTLVARARAFNLGPEDLDDLVHDCCDASASKRVNGDPTMPGDIEEAQEVAYGETNRIGSTVNNGGLESQVAFLLAELGEADLRSRLDILV